MIERIPFHLAFIDHGGSDFTIVGYFKEQDAFNDLQDTALPWLEPGLPSTIKASKATTLAELVEALNVTMNVIYEVITFDPVELLTVVGDMYGRLNRAD